MSDPDNYQRWLKNNIQRVQAMYELVSLPIEFKNFAYYVYQHSNYYKDKLQ